METTGHYWRNLFAFLVVHGFSVRRSATPTLLVSRSARPRDKEG
jgi:hypothetical protein